MVNAPLHGTDRFLESDGFLALIETSGNQSFVFASNRLRDNLGASFLLKQVCGQWLDEALAEQPEVQLVFRTSGRAVLFCESKSALEGVIGEITTAALELAPGLTVTGAVLEWSHEQLAGTDNSPMGAALRRLTEMVNSIAGQHLASVDRFPRMPLLAICADSQYPAEHHWRGNRISEICYRKREAGEAALRQLSHDLHDARRSGASSGGNGRPPRLPTLEELDRNVSASSDVRWFATVHIDGNGVGRTFIEIGGVAARSDEPNLLHHLLHSILSQGLDLATLDALAAGLEAAEERWSELVGATDHDDRDPQILLPLVYGGDDVTVVTDARLALAFTTAFLREFEARTAEVVSELRSLVADSVPGHPQWPASDCFSAAAGVSIHKPHHPFHAAYELAEELIQAAKSETRRAIAGDQPIPSSFDVHQLSDSGGVTLAGIRALRRSADGRPLWGGPYVTGSSTGYASPLRSVQWFSAALASVGSATGDDERIARRSLGKLRAAAFLGADHVDRVSDELKGSVPAALHDEDGLYRTIGGVTSSAIVDVADLYEWWG